MKRLIILLLFLPFFLISQDYKNYRGVQMCIAIQQSNAFSSNIEAEEALDMIMDVSGLNKNFILQPCEGINNALAIRFNNERYIIYDPEFMSKVDGIDKWRNLTILSHEVAHHLNNHTVEIEIAKNIERKTYELRKKQELEADEFAGFIMHKLDAPIDEVIKAISSVSFDGDDTYRTHPNRQKRVNAIKQGYKKSGYNENPVITYWEKFKKLFLPKPETKNEDVKPNKKTTSSKTFKLTARDFYIEKFNKSPDYGNYVDVSSSYFTSNILGSRVQEVLRESSHPRYGKLYEGLSYVNKDINMRQDKYDYHQRAKIKFYLGDTDGAMNDINKALSLDYDTYYLETRSMIKYLKDDFEGAISDVNTRLDERGKYLCKKSNYYLLTLYNVAKGDKQAAKKYFDLTVNGNFEWTCGDNEYLISKVKKLQPYIN